MYKTAIKILNKINEKGFKSYIVGGYPRDLYLNRTSIDIDICTNATPKDLKEIFNTSISSSREYGGVTVNLNNIRFEITTFRKELKYENNRFPVKIKYIDNLIDDLERRDFTINTLCIDEKGVVIDLLNAKKDIDDKLIKCVGNPRTKIKEDILRSLRAIRFATVLNFNIDQSLKNAIKRYGYLLKNLSYQRKKEELEKIFSSSNCKYGLTLIKELKIDKYLEIPNIDKIIITSSPLGIWAQIDNSNYKFSRHEQDIIKNIKKILNEDILDNKILYKYGLYNCTLAGEIKEIDRSLIVLKYNNLPILNKKDIDISSSEICELLNKKEGPFLKEIYKDLENQILENKLLNEKKLIKKYLLKNNIG